MAVDLYTERRTRGSTVRHQPINQARTGAVPTPLYRRATRRHQDDEELLDELATATTGGAPRAQYQQRRGSLRPVPNTHDDEQVAPGVRGGHSVPRYAPPQYPVKQPRHTATDLFLLLAGMLIVLVLFFFSERVYAWFMNTFHDPAYYTQAAHLDTVVVTDTQGTRFQIHAFVDTQNRIDLFILPDDPTKNHIIVGSTLTGIDDPQHKAILTIAANGTNVTVTAQGPYSVSWFTASQRTCQWSYDISQKTQQGG